MSRADTRSGSGNTYVLQMICAPQSLRRASWFLTIRSIQCFILHDRLKLSAVHIFVFHQEAREILSGRSECAVRISSQRLYASRMIDCTCAVDLACRCFGIGLRFFVTPTNEDLLDSTNRRLGQSRPTFRRSRPYPAQALLRAGDRSMRRSRYRTASALPQHVRQGRRRPSRTFHCAKRRICHPAAG